MSDPFLKPVDARHPAVRLAGELRAQPSARRRAGAYIAEGVKVVAEALEARAAIRQAIIAPRLRRDARGAALLSELRTRKIDLVAVDDRLMDRLSDTRTPQGVVAIIHLPRRAARLPRPRTGRPLLVAWHVQDPGNLGALLRSAHSLGASGLLAAGGGADPYHPRAVRAAAGAIFRLHADTGPESPEELLARLTEAGYKIAAAVPRGGGDPARQKWAGEWALLVGGEGGGLPQPLTRSAERLLTVPMQRGAESLSVPAAAAILLYVLGRRTGRRDAPSRWKPTGRPPGPSRGRPPRRGGRGGG